MNTKVPVLLDSATRFDSAKYLPKDTVVYYNTLLGFSNGEIDTALFERVMQPLVMKQVKEDKRAEYFRRLKAVFVFHYQYPNGELLHELIISPEQYRQKVFK